MRTKGKIWYVTALAFVYLVLCTIGSAYYISLHFRPNTAIVSVAVQLLCLGMAVAAGLYFFRAGLGHKALIALTILTLLAVGTSDAKAFGFHFCVLLILLIPFVTSVVFHIYSCLLFLHRLSFPWR